MVPVPVKFLVPVSVKNRPGPGPLKVKIWGIKNDIFIVIFIFKKKFSSAFRAKGVKYTSKFLKIVFCQNTSNFSDKKSAKKSIFLTSTCTRYYWGLEVWSRSRSRTFLVPVPEDSWSRSIPDFALKLAGFLRPPRMLLLRQQILDTDTELKSQKLFLEKNSKILKIIDLFLCPEKIVFCNKKMPPQTKS